MAEPLYRFTNAKIVFFLSFEDIEGNPIIEENTAKHFFKEMC